GNTYSGTTTVNAGLLELDKTAGNALVGALVINAATVEYGSHNNQIADASAVTVNSFGGLGLNGNNDTIGALTLTRASVDSEGGTLTLGGNVTVNASAIS